MNTLLSRKRYAVLHLRHRLQDIYAEIRWIGHGLQFAVLALVVIAGSGQAVVQLWNWLLPAIFELPIIGFWQAVGLLALG